MEPLNKNKGPVVCHHWVNCPLRMPHASCIAHSPALVSVGLQVCSTVGQTPWSQTGHSGPHPPWEAGKQSQGPWGEGEAASSTPPEGMGRGSPESLHPQNQLVTGCQVSRWELRQRRSPKQNNNRYIVKNRVIENGSLLQLILVAKSGSTADSFRS